MKVEESSLAVLPSQVKRRQSYYLPRPDSKQFKIDDYLLKKKRRSNENQLISPLNKKPKMIVNPFNKFSNFYLINSTDHCTSLNKLKETKSLNNHQNNLNKQQQQQNLTNNLTNKINNLNNHHLKCTNHLDNNLTSNLFNRKTGLPLSSSPIPQQKSSFSFERSIKSSNAIKRVILNKEPEHDENFNLVVKKSGNRAPLYKNLLGNFEESIINGRFNAVQTIFGKFRAEIGTSGKLYNNSYFCPDHLKMPVTVYFYNIHDSDNISASPYLAKVNLEKKGYLVPRKGNVQVTLFNPEDNVVKMFVVQYDLSDMPCNSQSFIRQKTYYMPKSFDCDKAAGSNKPNQINESLNSNLKNASNENCSSNKNILNGSNENSLNGSNQKYQTNNQTSNLPVSISTANLQSTLPTNLTKSSPTKSITKANDDKLCKFKATWLRYLIHLRFLSTKTGKIYLHHNISMLILRRNEFDPGNLIGSTPKFHWVTEQITEQSNNSKYSLR